MAVVHQPVIKCHDTIRFLVFANNLTDFNCICVETENKKKIVSPEYVAFAKFKVYFTASFHDIKIFERKVINRWI